jgi:hypothetical protein
VLDPEHGNERVRRWRYGTCHRCGWKGPVAKVGRQDRKRLLTGRALGRLCDACINDLLRRQAAPAGQTKFGRLKASRNRHVA